MNILAIGAHPDDVDLLCGGTLARYAAAGHRVTIAVATNGDVGSETLSREEIAAVRRLEAQRSCDVIGAELVLMEYDDEWLFDDRETRTTFIDVIRRAEPDILLAHSVSDYHPDHRIAGQVAADARIPSAVRLVETGTPALTEIPKLYTMDTIGQIDPDLDTLVDITDVMDKKLEMVTAHVSQRSWLDHIFGMDYVDFVIEQARRRGAELGVEFAEKFREVPSFPPARPDLALLGDIRPSHLTK